MTTHTPVLIAGGGPVGLILALELEHRGIDAVLVERNESTTRHPKMDVTNGRSMEHFRRLGIADEVRGAGVPSDHPMTVVYCTRVGEWELARFDYPSIDWGRDIIRYVNDGSMPLEPDLRISQAILEPTLKRILEDRGKHVKVRFGWALEGFEQDEDGVTSTIRSTATGETETIRSDYLAGCDGAGSVTRKGLGIDLDQMPARVIAQKSGGLLKTLFGAIRQLFRGQRPPDGRMYMIHFTSPEREFFERFGQAWHVQSPDSGTIISQNDRDTWTIHAAPPRGNSDEIDPKAYLFELLGREIECEIIVANLWRPQLVLAEQYGKGRVWLAGDSAHQVVPTGGYGMNTGVGDAVDLGWKLAALVEGWGGRELLEAYHAERHPVGARNREASARHVGIRARATMAASPAIHEDSPRGAEERKRIGALIMELGNLENEALGIEIGYRYDDSPVICHEEGGTPPPYDWERFTPSTWPGVRAPSLFLEDGRALHDLFGKGFTLVRFADRDVDPIVAAAAERGVPLEVVDVRDAHARTIYERDLVLLRPDQHVAWRSDEAPEDAGAIIDLVRGASA